MAINSLYVNHNHNGTNIIKYPILSNKALELVGDNQYSFVVSPSANKISIKIAVDYMY